MYIGCFVLLSTVLQILLFIKMWSKHVLVYRVPYFFAHREQQQSGNLWSRLEENIMLCEISESSPIMFL